MEMRGLSRGRAIAASRTNGDCARPRSDAEYDLSIVGTVGLPAAYGGFETLTENLVAGLAGRYKSQVFCAAKWRAVRPASYLGADLRYVRLNANGWQSIPYDVF